MCLHTGLNRATPRSMAPLPFTTPSLSGSFGASSAKCSYQLVWSSVASQLWLAQASLHALWVLLLAVNAAVASPGTSQAWSGDIRKWASMPLAKELITTQVKIYSSKSNLENSCAFTSWSLGYCWVRFAAAPFLLASVRALWVCANENQHNLR